MVGVECCCLRLAERLSEACGPGMPGPYWVVTGAYARAEADVAGVVGVGCCCLRLAERLTEACGPGMPGPYGVVKERQSATGGNPSGAAAPPPFDKGGRERRGQDPSLRNGRFNGSRRKVCGPGMPGPYRVVKGKQSATRRESLRRCGATSL